MERTEPDDITRFLDHYPDWADIPEEHIRRSLAFQGFTAGEAVHELFDVIAEALRLPQMVDWLSKQLGRL